MKLTPIKVRGKGGPSKVWQPPNPANINKKRKAPEDTDHDNGEDRGTHDGSSKIPKAGSSRRELERRLTTLEMLPVELLENIVTMSENPHLLRASLWIGSLFTHRSAMQELLIGAFAPTWDRWHSLNRDEIWDIEIRRVAEHRLPQEDDAGGNPEFQSGILACEWVTIDHLLSAQKVWYRRSRKQRFTIKNPWGWWLVRKHAENGKEEDDHNLRPVEDPTAVFEQDWNALVKEFEDPRTAWDGEKLQFSPNPRRGGYLELHPRTRVPDHLLKGPWSPKKVEYLFWLIRGGAQILDSHHWEYTKQGYESILSLTDEELFEQYHDPDPAPLPFPGKSSKDKDQEGAPPRPQREPPTAEQLQKILIFLFHKLGVFYNHWPMHLLQEKHEDAITRSNGPHDVLGIAINMLGESLMARINAQELAQATRRAYLTTQNMRIRPLDPLYSPGLQSNRRSSKP
ncbi:hypothetical protein QBC35DRAFT_552340 [Podospora australis]|uniref:Uncharacterized protein n=1 Tax=Podospora australis TaxID=1536484 RepID=A0AAN7AIL0_9PEZI|nr:hypothetical protein QBC35DRAFT_552340 [Podospora australis]